MKIQTVLRYFVLLSAGLCLLSAGCGGPKSGKGFTLPEGDVERGETAFVSLKCYSCHTVSGVKLPPAEVAEKEIVALGGKTLRIQTYGELVTSIINPSHKVAKGFAEEPTEPSEKPKSRMVNNNDAMKVSQLIDLVKFLQSHYELEEYEPTPYPMY